jgi:starvation-inducible DNA-binding protein
LPYFPDVKTLFTTKNNLSQATRTKVTVILNQLLADLTDLYSQTKQAHWNVRGSLFFQLHKLFDELAGSVEGHIDPLAERITTLGGIANGTVRQAAARSSLPEFPTAGPNELGYVTALIDRYAHSATAVRQGIDDTAALGDADSADLLTALSRDLDKALWFLEAHTRK